MLWYNALTGLQGQLGCCYHRVNEDLREVAEDGGILDRMSEAIAKEIESTQVLLRDAVHEAMECEAINF